MIDRELDIQTGDGLMNTFITYPEEGGPFPVVLFYMDAPGKREELHDMARRIGTAGYYVVLPNLYYRTERNFVIDASDATRAHMFELMNFDQQPPRQRRHAGDSRFSRWRGTRELGADRLRRLLHERTVRSVRCGRICAADGGRGVVLRRAPVYRRAGLTASDGRARSPASCTSRARRPMCGRRRR